MRITKEPEIRKNELMETASELFYKNGYKETSVDMIVKKIGVAKGLFYYYFPKKIDVLISLENEFMEKAHSDLAYVTSLKEIPFEKLLDRFIDFYFITIRNNLQLISLSVQNMDEDRKNLEVRLKEMAIMGIDNIMKNAKVIKNLSYKKETVSLIISGFSDLYLSGITDKNIYITIFRELLYK